MHWFIHHVQSHQITCQKISSEENQSVKPELNPRSFMDGKDLCKLNKQYLTALMFMFCTFFLDKIAKLWHNLAKLTATELPLLSALVKPSSSVLDLGVNIDGQLTTSPHYAGRACFNYASYRWSDLPWLWGLRRHWCTHLSAAVLITATVCCTGSVKACWRNCRLSRMQQRN